MIAVKVEQISKKYGEVQALNKLSFEVNRGEVYGIIGPDGAGKTTLFHILTTLLLADEGVATVDGLDVRKDYRLIRNSIGYMPGKFALYQDMTIEENLNFFATVFNTTVKENYHLIKDIYQQIEPFKKRRAGKLSGGMKQKLALCCALIHKPSVLFLDEPTTGVDPVSRKEFWEMLRKLKEENISILVSTPYMDEATLCDRIALIQKGSFLQVNTPENIIKQFDEILWTVKSDEMFRLLNDLRQNDKVKSCFTFGEVHHLTVKANLTQAELKAFLLERKHQNIEIKETEATIEDCYMQLGRDGIKPN